MSFIQPFMLYHDVNEDNWTYQIQQKVLMKNQLFNLSFIALLLTGCGGGGSVTPSTATTTTATEVNYTAAATIGELINYKIDTSKLTYSYTITDSQYGLDGKSGSGTLIRNANGTYSPSGISNGKIAVLPNGLMMGALRETINGTLTTIPVLGISNPVADLSKLADIYDYVAKLCIPGGCAVSYGTARISADGTVQTCVKQDIASAQNGICTKGSTATLNSLGNGVWQYLKDGIVIGTLLGINTNGKKTFILDLKNKEQLGTGLIVAANQTPITNNDLNGTWHFHGSYGSAGYATIQDNQVKTFTPQIDGATSFITLNSPLNGFVTNTVGTGLGVLAGTGVYAWVTPALNYFEVGLKLQ